MVDLTTLFIGSEEAEKENVTYKPGETFELDGPTDLKSVGLVIVNLQSELILAELWQDISGEEYDFKWSQVDTQGWPATSSESEPALAYQIKGHDAEGKIKVLRVGFLVTEPVEEANAQSQTQTGSGESQTQSSGSEGTETTQSQETSTENLTPPSAG